MNDAVNQPKHYELFLDIEAIQVIASSMTIAEYRGYCFGNTLKYRLRVGKKDAVEQDLSKADNYAHGIFHDFKHLCRDESLCQQSM